MKFYDINKYLTGLFMYKVFFEVFPKPILSLFETNVNIHDYDTRQKYNFHPPKPNSNAFKRTIVYKGVEIWSYIRKNIGINCSFERFKKRLKSLYSN